MKITVWGIKQAIWGSDHSRTLYFKTIEERDAFFATVDHADKLRARKVNAADLIPALRDEWDEDSVIPGAYTL